MASFHLFSSLPTELRLKIWTFNPPAPRLVSLRYTSATSNPSNPSTRKELRGCTSSTYFPVNLHINKEARTHSLKRYRLSFNLSHSPPKILFDLQSDVLYFPAKEGWLGSWNHFVNALTMIVPGELSKVKRLAVHEALFRSVAGANSSPNVRTTCMKEFWEYMRKKFGTVEEIVILVENKKGGMHRDDEVMVWMEGVLGCVLGKDERLIGSPEERLFEELETGLRHVEMKSEWKAPRWKMLGFPVDGEGVGTVGWPAESLKESCSDTDEEQKDREMLDSIVIPHSELNVKHIFEDEQSFWMGGQLPRWHYLANL